MGAAQLLAAGINTNDLIFSQLRMSGPSGFPLLSMENHQSGRSPSRSNCIENDQNIFIMDDDCDWITSVLPVNSLLTPEAGWCRTSILVQRTWRAECCKCDKTVVCRVPWCRCDCGLFSAAEKIKNCYKNLPCRESWQGKYCSLTLMTAGSILNARFIQIPE